MCAAQIDPGIGVGTRVFHCGDGYSFHSNGEHIRDVNVKTIYLKCVNYTTALHCLGRAVVYVNGDNSEWLDTAPHTCLPDPHLSGQRLLRHEILEECRREVYVPPRQLANRIAARYPVEVAARVVNANLRPAMLRARNALYPAVVPNSLQDLDRLMRDPAYHHLAATINGGDYLYQGTVGPRGQMSAVFASQRMLNYMSRVKEVFVDATFVPTPLQPNGAQVLQISAIYRFNVIPLLVAHMESKSYIAYRSLFNFLEQLMPRFAPDVAMMDFERQQSAAWQEVFPHCVVKGCYVHFIRRIRLKCQNFGLVRVMNRNRNLRLIIRSTYAIPLLPHGLMNAGFRTVIRMAVRAELLVQLLRFFAYFVRTWMTGNNFLVLSVYNQLHRTNNASESANRLLRIETGPHHPNFWQFLSAIQRYEQAAYTGYRTLRRGGDIGRGRRPATLLNDRVIRNLTTDLLGRHISMKRFLRMASVRALGVFGMPR